MKFGGTSVGSVKSILSLKEIVEAEAGRGPVVVVVSALNGITDKLIATSELAKNGDSHYREEFEAMVTRHHQMIDAIIQDDKKRIDLFNNVDQLFDQLRSIYYGVFLIHDLSEKTQDTIISYGERLSSHIVAAMIKNGMRMNARDFIRTENKEGKHVLDTELTTQLVKETFKDVPENTPTHVSLGVMSRAKAKDGSLTGDLSIDSYSVGGEKEGVVHWNDADHPLKHDLASASGGCSCSKRSVQGLALASSQKVEGASTWIAQKNDYFVTAILGCSENPSGFAATVARQNNAEAYVPQSVSVAAAFNSLKPERTYTLYVGPKKQALLWDLGLKDVMDFGMWRWLCYGMVWVLNLFYALIPNYGVAIILLTILVRVLFWPLTHKSTVGMRKMQEIQPLLKEVQAKYKGNPQRLQQETWQLYREHKVNPLSSCLPMLIQIPVFFALFVVLRGAVELRYAPFLWIRDLSQPEALFASWFPFGGLNILPILMAATMALQSALSPSAGDKSQQRMMMVFMPIMMLVMFYNFASALSLYWTLSQVISIAQTWWIRKKYGAPSSPAAGKGGVIEPDAVEMPQTRQMRRHP